MKDNVTFGQPGGKLSIISGHLCILDASRKGDGDQHVSKEEIHK